MKKIVIVSPYATVAPHFETELEIAQRHLDKGDRVTIISCMGELANCDFNDTHQSKRCDECRGRRIDGFKQLRGNARCRTFKSVGKNKLQTPRVDATSVEQLKNLKLGQFDIGYAVLSSLVSNLREPRPNLQQYSELINRFYDSANHVYSAMLRYLDRHRPDKVYVFNGRFAAMRGVLRACQERSVECVIHERGWNTHHYQLYHNRLPHDIQYMEQRMKTAWETADPATRHDTAAAWFESRVNRVEQNWHSFVKDQTKGKLPAGWDSNRHNVVLFNSSEDEFAAIGDMWTNHTYPDQVTGIIRIARSLQQQARQVHLTVRVHPNLKHVDNHSTRQILALDMPNLSVVPAHDTVDSYQLLRASDTVVTFGSGMGIESVYWGKPSILLGPSFYQNLGGTYQPAKHEEAIQLMSCPLNPLSKTGALIYGHWFQTHGIRFKHFEPTGLFSGTFQGKLIYPKNKKTVATRMARRLRSIKKRVARLVGPNGTRSNRAA